MDIDLSGGGDGTKEDNDFGGDGRRFVIQVRSIASEDEPLWKYSWYMVTEQGVHPIPQMSIDFPKGHMLCIHGSTIYLFGGLSNRGYVLCSDAVCIKMDDIMDHCTNWTPCDSMVTGRSYAPAAAFGSKIYVFDGTLGYPGPVPAEAYDVESNKWSPLSSFYPPQFPYNIVTACVTGFRLPIRHLSRPRRRWDIKKASPPPPPPTYYCEREVLLLYYRQLGQGHLYWYDPEINHFHLLDPNFGTTWLAMVFLLAGVNNDILLTIQSGSFSLHGYLINRKAWYPVEVNGLIPTTPEEVNAPGSLYRVISLRGDSGTTKGGELCAVWASSNHPDSHLLVHLTKFTVCETENDGHVSLVARRLAPTRTYTFGKDDFFVRCIALPDPRPARKGCEQKMGD